MVEGNLISIFQHFAVLHTKKNRKAENISRFSNILYTIQRNVEIFHFDFQISTLVAYFDGLEDLRSCTNRYLCRWLKRADQYLIG